MTDSGDKGRATVGPREAAAAGVIAMGIFTIFLPGAVSSIVSPDQAFITLWAMNVLAGLFIIGTGIAVLRARE
jgi:hypothetical protein